VRFTPSLTFQLDALPDNARQLEDLLAIAAAEDAKVEAARRGAVPAGEADPYRKPRIAEDDAEQ
jgi:ribosome-binding factor A